jgi:hypothetical protein
MPIICPFLKEIPTLANWRNFENLEKSNKIRQKFSQLKFSKDAGKIYRIEIVDLWDAAAEAETLVSKNLTCEFMAPAPSGRQICHQTNKTVVFGKKNLLPIHFWLSRRQKTDFHDGQESGFTIFVVDIR